MHSRFKFKAEDFEQYFLDLMAGRRRNWYDRVLTDVLFIASRFYRMAIQFRIWMYDKRVIRNHALGCLVVSIGNLSCGGTGKTPVVEVFARTLSSQGRRVAILSRGYRSKKRSLGYKLMHMFQSQKIEIPPKVVSDGKDLLLESDYAGDEPYMLASNLRDVAVLVDKDRVKSGIYAVDRYQTDVIILDDGFQYLMLKPHINIVLVDSTDPFGNGHVLPRGILREPIKNIRRADYIFLTKSDGSHKLRHLKNFLAPPHPAGGDHRVHPPAAVSGRAFFGRAARTAGETQGGESGGAVGDRRPRQLRGVSRTARRGAGAARSLCGPSPLHPAGDHRLRESGEGGRSRVHRDDRKGRGAHS